MSNLLSKQTECTFTPVIQCIQLSDVEYELVLKCGHRTRIFTLRSKIVPKKIVCKECYHEDHDKYGNKI